MIPQPTECIVHPWSWDDPDPADWVEDDDLDVSYVKALTLAHAKAAASQAAEIVELPDGSTVGYLDADGNLVSEADAVFARVLSPDGSSFTAVKDA